MSAAIIQFPDRRKLHVATVGEAELIAAWRSPLATPVGALARRPGRRRQPLRRRAALR